jgi:hypothetical protein
VVPRLNFQLSERKSTREAESIVYAKISCEVQLEENGSKQFGLD